MINNTRGSGGERVTTHWWCTRRRCGPLSCNYGVWLELTLGWSRYWLYSSKQEEMSSRKRAWTVQQQTNKQTPSVSCSSVQIKITSSFSQFFPILGFYEFVNLFSNFQMQQINLKNPDKTVILNTVKVNIFMNLNMLLTSHFGVL